MKFDCARMIEKKATSNHMLRATVKECQYNMLVSGKDTYFNKLTMWTGVGENDDFGVHNVQIGSNTAIGINCVLYVNVNHDYKSVFQGAIFEYQKEEGVMVDVVGQNMRYADKHGQILIGNDVWIGQDVTIMSG